MITKTMFKYLTAVMFLLNSGPAWGEGNDLTAGVAAATALKEADIQNNRITKCADLRKELRKLKSEAEVDCKNAGFENCTTGATNCGEVLKTPRSKRKSSNSISQMGALLSSQLGIPLSSLNSLTTSKKANLCPQISGKSYLSEEERVEKKIESLKDKIKTANEKITDAMEDSTKEQKDLDDKVKDLQEEIDDAKAEFDEDKDEVRKEELENAKAAAEELNSLKTKLSESTKKIKSASNEVAKVEEKFRSKQSSIPKEIQKKRSCIQQVTGQADKVKESLSKSASATARSDTLKKTLEEMYRACMRQKDNAINEERIEFQTKIEELNSAIVQGQEEIKQLNEQILNSQNFELQAKTNQETRTKELEGKRDQSVKRLETAMNSAKTNFIQVLTNLKNKISNLESETTDLKSRLLEAENERTALMAIAPSREEILTTSQSDKSPISVARGISAKIQEIKELEDEIAGAPLFCGRDEQKKSDSNSSGSTKPVNK